MQTWGETRAWTTGAATVVGPGCWVPDLPRHYVRRERLEARLDDAVRSRLAVVTGPAGGGKSVLLAGWARRRRAGSTAWLSVESADNEPVRFWLRLVRALQVVDHDVSDSIVAARSAGVSDSRVAEMLAGELTILRPVVVVLDDIHRIDRAELIQAVVHLVGLLPSHVHLIVTTRQPADLGVHRLRMSGDLAEIDQDDLRFNPDEASRLLLSVAERPIPSGDVERLATGTEGWAAGLYFAGLSLADEKGGPGAAAARNGDSRLVCEYFQHDVLMGLPPETVRFLMETSVLETMTAELCQEVTGRADAVAILEDLADRHLFCLRSDAKPNWYRYHRLFADFLQHRLAVQDPAGARHARLRAADWLARNSHEGAAFDHLVRSHAYDQAMRLGAAGVTRQLGTGQPSHGDAWLPGELPQSYLEGDPWHMYLVAAALLGQRRRADAAWWLQRLTRSVSDTPATVMLGARVEMLWTIHDGLGWDAGWGPRAPPTGHRPDRRLRTPRSRPSPGRGGHARVGGIVGCSCRRPTGPCGGLGPSVVGSVRPGSCRPGRLGREAAGGRQRGLVGVAGHSRDRDGQLRDAYALARRALDEATRGDGAEALDAGPARLALARVLRERDELDAAQRLLTDAIDTCHDKGQVRWAAAV